MRTLAFVVPGSLATRTGGYRYDERIVTELRSRTWQVAVHQLSGSYPFPDAAALAAATLVFESLPDEQLVLVDGLALGGLAALANSHRHRLQIVALIHHPLALETGLTNQTADQLIEAEQQALQASCGVIVTSHATASLLRPYGIEPEAVKVVEPGTDTPKLELSGQSTRPTPITPARLLCVASLTPRKGHGVLFESLAPWRDADWSLVCIGNQQRDPACAKALRQQLSKTGLSERVSLTGEVDDQALDRHYQRADCFVFASHFEGYGMVFDEAVAWGLPVISTRVGAVESAVPEAARALVPTGDVAELSRVLGRFIRDPDWRASLTASALAAAASDHRSWQAAAVDFDRALCALAS